MRVVLGVAGGIAAYKAASLLRLLTEAGHDVTVVPTAAALNFVGEATWSALSGRAAATGVFSHAEDVPHVRLGKEADLVIVAPATADLLARAAAGLADDLLTNVLLTARCPVLLAPAMHTEMWEHPATVANVETLTSRGVHIVPPASGRLTGADTGPGRLPEPEELFDHAIRAVTTGQAARASTPAGDLAGLRIVVTAGGTREPLDPVRYLGNRSSGKQGYALAERAARRGAAVRLITTANRPTPDGVEVVEVETALEMQAAVADAATGADVVVMAAAVADFRPGTVATAKIKKTHGGPADQDAPAVTLVRNPDILAGLVQDRGAAAAPLLVGFAAETGDQDGSVLEHARAKLARKGCDLLVVNEVGPGLTFGQDESRVWLLERSSSQESSVGPAPKTQIADAIWDRVRELVR